MTEVSDLLTVQNLRTSFFTPHGEVKAVNDVSFSIKAGEILGVVGESGSGKSITAYSILRLIDNPGRIAGGTISFKGRDLVAMPDSELRSIRGNDIAMIFQDPALTLNPTLRIDTQMCETILAHRDMKRSEALKICLKTLEKVGIPAPAVRLKQYPHQLSGGMRQRIAIAIAMLLEPTLIIADEPTTALDVTTQTQILHEMQSLCKASGTALVWITHDLSLLAEIADRVCVMYAGKIVEEGPIDAVIDTPRHPYTAGLLNSLPSAATRGKRLTQIDGITPSLLALPKGCSFAPRCPLTDKVCDTPADHRKVGPGHYSRCHHSEAYGRVSQ